MFYGVCMDRNFAIERSRGRLVAVVLGLFAEIGLTGGGVVEKVSKPLYRKVQRVLRSAESAVRRLIIAAARDIVVEPKPKRPAAARKSSSQINSKAEGEDHARRKRGLLFRLFDRPRRKDWGIPRRRKTRKIQPRIRVLGDDPDPRHLMFRLYGQPQPAAPAPAPVPEKDRSVDDGTVSAIRLCRRLIAIMGALEDIPRQARRYARWRGKPLAERRPRRESPLRLGWPPGWRIRATHEVDEILKDCHWLVRNLEPQLDTS